MSELILLIYPIALLLISFYGCKVAGKGEFASDIWNRNQSSLLQGIFCIAIMLHHLTQLITGYGEIYLGPITYLSSMGILFTSVFFFFSGYGLIYSFYNKENYLENFLIHRLPVILVPFFIANTVYLLVRVFYTGIPTSPLDAVKCITGIVLLNGNGWYMVEIFYFYLVFYLAFRFIKNKDVSLIILTVFSIAVIYFGLKSGRDTSEIGGHWFKGEWWYNSTIVFVMGIWFARYRLAIIAAFKKAYRVLLPVTTALFLVGFAIEERIRKVYGYYHETGLIDRINPKLITLIAQSVLCLIFMLLVLLINMKVTLNNKVIKALSLISTELFLIHNLFVHSIFDFLHMPDVLIYAIVIICSIAAAILFHFACRPIMSLFHAIEVKRDYLKGCADDIFRERRERRNKRLGLLAVVIMLALLFAFGIVAVVHSTVTLPREFEGEVKSLSDAVVGDEIEFGRYDTDYLKIGDERLKWIVLSKTDSEVILLSKYGIYSSTYMNSHVETTWENSDLRNYLNNVMFNQIFSSYEQEIVKSNPKTNDMLSLLSVAEAYKYFESDDLRQIEITSAAEKMGANVNVMSKVNYWDSKGYRSSWWWLRGDDESSITAPIVTVDGAVLENDKNVNKPNGVVRPVVIVDLYTCLRTKADYRSKM